MIRQTGAIFLDAYRELNAKKLFWIVLGLSALFVVVFAGVGINEEGASFLIWDIPNPILNLKTLPSEAYFYKTLFFTLGFQIWLTWIATILALISTCGIIPDFVAAGSIELSLSKPIGRARLFLTKFLAATLFVVLQVAVFTVASFIIVGIKGDVWVWSFFLAIPLVTLFFSYLYAVCAVIGLITRSTIAALLLTLLFWFVVFIVDSTESIFLQMRETHHEARAIIQGELDIDRQALEDEEDERKRERLAEDIATNETNLESAQRAYARWNNLQAVGYGVKTILPKTRETMEYLGRFIISDAELTQQLDQSDESGAFGGQRVHGVYVSNRNVSKNVQEAMRDRSVFWVIGTSILFEAAVLSFGAWRFSRKDY